MFKVILCDDNAEFLELEQSILKLIFEESNIVGEIKIFHSSEEMISFGTRINEYQLALIDVEMDGKNGMEAAKRIRMYSEIPIAFVTSFIDYALDGYKVGAVRYILKQPGGLKAAIAECIGTIYKDTGRKSVEILLPCREQEIRLTEQNFIFAESKLHYAYLHLYEQDVISEYSIRETLDDLGKMISFSGIIRIHKSYLVNAAFIKYMKRYEVEMRTGRKLPISQKKYGFVRRVYTEYLGERV